MDFAVSLAHACEGQVRIETRIGVVEIRKPISECGAVDCSSGDGKDRIGGSGPAISDDSSVRREDRSAIGYRSGLVGRSDESR